MTLVIKKPTTSGFVLRQTWRPMDPDAATYIAAVEAADGQALEEKTKIAIDNFVLGCKTDGIWTAIKASCILAGARTLAGALVPLAGAAPTNFNFAAGDYNRKTGLVGDGSTKYLNSNRAGNADPQNIVHIAVYASQATTSTSSGPNSFPIYIGCGTGENGSNHIGRNNNNSNFFNLRNRSGSAITNQGGASSSGLIGASRSTGAEFVLRAAGASTTISLGSQAAASSNYGIYRAISLTSLNDASTYANARLAFYSIGESLNLALLDARVTTLINALAIAIP